MSEPAAVRRDRRRSVGRVVTGGVLSWVLVLGGLRAFVVQAEQCGDPTTDELRAAAGAAVDWFRHNQRDDGAWLYRYDRATDTDVGSYNITRHAGVTMSLEQAAGARLPESEAAALSAERGIEWALERMYEGPGWRAFAGEGDGQFGSGASALLTAALVLRRERTGDDRYDDVLHDLGAFLTAMVNEHGQVYGQYDRAAGAAVPDSWSKYFTGETFWALTLLHRAFPDAGYGVAAERIAHYIATERREVEGFQPDVPDHWAAYGFAVMTTWPGWELPDEYLPYVRRQAGLQSLQIRYESQRTNSLFSYRTRGRQTLGAGLGTIGEALANWEIVAAATPALADIREPLAERARCVGGAAIERQVRRERRRVGRRLAARGRRVVPVRRHPDGRPAARPVGVARRRGADRNADRDSLVNWIVAVVAVLTAIDVPQRARLLRRAPAAQRAVAGVGLVAVAVALAFVATPLLDLLDISSPTMEVGAGLVLALWSAVALVRWDDEPAPEAIAGGLLPLLFPIVLTPVVGVTVVAVAARNGWWLPVLATAVGAVPIAIDAIGRPLAHRQVATAVGVDRRRHRRRDDRRRRPRRLTHPLPIRVFAAIRVLRARQERAKHSDDRPIAGGTLRSRCSASDARRPGIEFGERSRRKGAHLRHCRTCLRRKLPQHELDLAVGADLVEQADVQMGAHLWGCRDGALGEGEPVLVAEVGAQRREQHRLLVREVGVNEVVNVAGSCRTAGAVAALEGCRRKLVKGGVELLVFSAQLGERVSEGGSATSEERPEIGVLAAVMMVEHGDHEVAQLDDRRGRRREWVQRIGQHRRDPSLGIVHELGLEDRR